MNCHHWILVDSDSLAMNTPSSSSLPHRNGNDGYFHTKSPMGSSHNPNPRLGLASNIILQYFGPTVQTVADCLLYHFPSSDDTITGDPGASLSEIISCILSVCSRNGGSPESGKDLNHSTDYHPVTERDRILSDLKRKNPSSFVRWNRSKGSEEKGYVVEEPIIRAALLTLVHHSLVRVRKATASVLPSSLKSSYKYSMDIPRILYIPRYGRWVDWTRTRVFSITSSSSTTNSVSATLIGACLIQELCIHGRMLSMELLLHCRELLDKQGISLPHAAPAENNIPLIKSNDVDEPDNDDMISKSLVEVFKQLVDRGFIELVSPMNYSLKEADEKEADLSDVNASSTTRSSLSGQKRAFSNLQEEKDVSTKNDSLPTTPSFPILSATLQAPKYKRYLPRGAVWRVNAEMFHAHMRAHFIGRLVHERFGDQVTSAGHIVTAVLRLLAHRQHSPLVQETTTNNNTAANPLPFPFVPKEQRRSRMISGDACVFSPDDIMEYVSPQVVSTLQAKPGGVRSQLSTILVSLSRSSNPSVIMEVESAHGHPKGGKFEVAIRNIVVFMKQFIARQMVRDHQGEIAIRIISILESRGYAESETIAEAAMIPSKDAREALHRLYKSNYIDLMCLQNSKQHNPGTAIYLWGVVQQRLQTTVLNNVCKAFCNIRLRQQHEVQLGKQWLERAEEASTADENEVEMDKLRRSNFLKGLERLDQACMQLDETLMALTCFV